ncbi:Pentatricopeptide repeat [Dillenia turbinata]|uniref:Pentatricopeptide repeat n=1 Tax=Dillenia turbinata TaxID=194707 RepID=A0AAN8UTD9_9MAGN
MFLSTFAATIPKFKSSPEFLYLSLTYPSIAIARHFKSSVTHYPKPNAVSPISLVVNYLKNDRLDEAEALFEKINTFDVKLCSMMITGYTQNGRLNDALKLFYEMRSRDVICWNSILKGCLDCGDLDMAMKLFDEMPERNVISWTTILNGFLQFGRIEMAECLFDRMPYKDIAAWNSMIHGYCCSGRAEDAMMLFRRMPRRNVISWTSMISGLDEYGKYREALYLFGEMLVSGVEPTSSTYCCVIAACGNERDLHLGSQIHADIVKLGYGLNGKHEDALKVVFDMVRLGIFPNQHTFTSALNSCCELEAIERGKEIHTAAIKLGLETDVFVGNSLVVMYSTCGDVSDGMVAFRKTRAKNTVSWNSIIVGCAQHGCGMLALIFFSQMLRAEVEPDSITFTGLLSACGHSGIQILTIWIILFHLSFSQLLDN